MAAENPSIDDVVGDWEIDVEDEVVSATEETSATVEENGSLPATRSAVEASGMSPVQADSTDSRHAASRNAPSVSIAEQYIASLYNASGLHVSIADQVAKAYDKKVEHRIFSLFFTSVFKDRLLDINVLVLAGNTPISNSEFNAYLGLEIAMSIWPLGEIAEFWSERRF
ncbi:LOW QUALITY PROTEIN: hypothetical protein PHMEG_000335 [Phytophthora megakarya]|uniref:PiggyBac transposable element-derived protein domain-containing protein n=1 Tax=Phytophthora megakarya TaxID=4795 RepID=A0A225X3A2_9STRA|nr:LOW QUALITY PROTEIN: hypothetical protein PHMEG_000335 [Phytophthora megakarya]